MEREELIYWGIKVESDNLTAPQIFEQGSVRVRSGGNIVVDNIRTTEWLLTFLWFFFFYEFPSESEFWLSKKLRFSAAWQHKHMDDLQDQQRIQMTEFENWFPANKKFDSANFTSM